MNNKYFNISDLCFLLGRIDLDEEVLLHNNNVIEAVNNLDRAITEVKIKHDKDNARLSEIYNIANDIVDNFYDMGDELTPDECVEVHAQDMINNKGEYVLEYLYGFFDYMEDDDPEFTTASRLIKRVRQLYN